MADFKDLMDTTPDTNYEKDLSLSQRLEKAKNSVEWQENPLFNTADAMKASRNPINRIYGTQDLHKLTSDAGTIAWDTFRKGVIDLASLPDKVEMAIGNTLAGVSGNTLGTEMRDRAYDNLMKTMEDSRFIDSNYGDAETWTARFTGGAMSMGEMLAIGALSGGVGLGAFVGTTSLSDGALNDMANYYEEHGNLDGYETDPLNLALDYGNAVFQIASEMALGTGRLLNGKVLKHGSTTAAIAKETVNNFIQESVQGLAADATEVLKSNEDVDILLENFGGYVKDGIVGGVLGGVTGGTFYRVNKNRGKSTIKEVGKKLYPEKNEKELDDFAEEVWAKTEEKELKSFAPEIIAHTEAVNDKGKIRDNIRQKVELMYKDADMSEKQRAKTVEATTTVELENMLYDSIERRIPLTSHPLLQGEVNELGWFRTGIPENRRAEIDALNKELVDLKAQQKELMSAQEKDYAKLEDVETKIEQFRKDLPAKLGELVVADRQQIQDMLAEQRRFMAERKAIRSVRERARKAIAKQDQQEQADKDKLAEQIAKGAEKAKEQRVKAETKKQTQEAKARTLTEQRQIQSSIKNIKVKVNNTKTAKNLELKYAIDQATDDSLRAVLKKREWNEYTVKHMTRRQLKAAVRELTDVSVAELVPMSAREISREQALQEKKVEKKTTAKSFFHRQINRKFANDSGILQAWGYSKDDSAINLVFVKDGGYADWNEIVMALQDSGYLPQSAEDTYEQTDALVDKAKDIVLNNKELGFTESDMTVEEMDYTSVVGYDWLIEAGYTPEQIDAMTDEEMATKLKEIFAQTQPVEPEYTEEQTAEWDTIQYQDLADENARLDDIYPEYKGETINIDGKERTVYNSNGERIAKSEPALRNFWNWFGDSKVVDKDGRPLVVYHGTRQGGFSQFDKSFVGTSSGNASVGFFFADYSIAKTYSGSSDIITKEQVEEQESFDEYERDELVGLYPVYLKINDPAIWDYNDASWDGKAYGKYALYNEEEYDWHRAEDGNVMLFDSYQEMADFVDEHPETENYTQWDDPQIFDTTKEIAQLEQENGFNGVIFRNINDEGKYGYGGTTGTVYVAFEPNQIKSTQNRGTFSPDTGNIYYQKDLFDSIIEGSVKDKNDEHRVHVNPTSTALQGILNIEGSQRLLISKKTGNWYFADSKKSIHKNMLQTLIDNELETGKQEDVFNSDLFDTYMIDNGTEQEYEGNYFLYGTKANISWFMGNPFGMDKIKSNFESVIEKHPKLKDILGEFDEKKNATLLAKRLEKEIRVEESKIKNFGVNTEYFDSLTQRKNALMEKYNIKQEDIDNFYNNQKNAAFDSLSKLREFYKQPQMQTKTTGKGKDTFRGAFIPEYRFIATTSNLDASTLNHELAHDWGQENFRWARSGKASESFLRSWGAVEKAIGITEKDTYFTYDASEKFARAYEGWLLQRSDWAELLHIDNEEEKQAVSEAMEDYRKELVDIYDSLNNEYFKMTWGKTGELKPELKEWFERSTKFDELDNKVARGEITEEQASEEKLGEMLESATNATVENMSVKDKHTTDVLETLETMKEQERQFEVEGGNTNSLQRRLNKIALAQNITANNAVLGKYDTHRDMLAVAEAADNFVNTRLNDALAIINGKMPEQDGLYASDLYTALERKAKAENDFELIEELRNSLVANQLAKELGQRVAGFRNYTASGDVDIMSTLKSLDKLYDKAYNEKERQQLEYDIKDYFESVKMADSQQDLDGFFNDLECK